MEFNKKLQELRKQKNLSQEELASALFVSRTAISKWESGRGYPSIDSLKAISNFFSITIDDLLSGQDAIAMIEETKKQKETYFRDLIFALLDLSCVVLLFLPFFAQKYNDVVQAVSVLQLTASHWKIIYTTLICANVISGIVLLALQNCQKTFWTRAKYKISFFVSGITVFVFILGSHPYASIFLCLFLIIKLLTIFKKQS